MSSPIASTFGEAVLGIFFSAILYGLTLSQAVTYFTHSKSDPFVIRSVVAITLFVSTISLVVTFHAAWYYLIESYGLPQNLKTVDWGILVDTFLAGMSACIVQLFYAWRVRKLGHTWIIVGIIVITAVVPIAFDISLGVDLATTNELSVLSDQVWKLASGLGCRFLSDVVIAAAIGLSLSTSKCGIKRTDSVLNWLIFYTVSTGVITALFALVGAILYITLPRTFAGVLIQFCTPQVYTLAMLASLNAREEMRGFMSSELLPTVSSPAIGFGNYEIKFPLTLAQQPSAAHLWRPQDSFPQTPSVRSFNSFSSNV